MLAAIQSRLLRWCSPLWGKISGNCSSQIWLWRKTDERDFLWEQIQGQPAWLIREFNYLSSSTGHPLYSWLARHDILCGKVTALFPLILVFQKSFVLMQFSYSFSILICQCVSDRCMISLHSESLMHHLEIMGLDLSAVTRLDFR